MTLFNKLFFILLIFNSSAISLCMQTNSTIPVIDKYNVKDYNLNIDQRIQDHKNGKIYIQIGDSKAKVKTRIYRNLNIYFWNRRGYIASTVFEELAEKNRLDLITKILDYDPQAASDPGFLQALNRILLHKNSVELTKVFIDTIDPNQEFDGMNISPLSETKAIPLVKLLLIHNANPNKLTNPNGLMIRNMTPLSLSCVSNDPLEKLKLLIIGGGNICVDPDTSNSIFLNKDLSETYFKRKNLFKAIKKAQDLQELRSFQLPLKHVRDTKGNSLLYHALRNQNYIIAKTLFCLWPTLLIQHNFDGKTALDMLPVQSITALTTNFN